MGARLKVLLLVVSFLPIYTRAQSLPEWHNDFIQHLSGNWKVEGHVMGRETHHDIAAEWVLNHQFLRICEKTSASAPASESRYEAIWFLGYDSVSERYVLHLFDVFGTRYSETLGYGIRDGNNIRFMFEYPEGPFHNTYRWFSDNGTWQ